MEPITAAWLVGLLAQQAAAVIGGTVAHAADGAAHLAADGVDALVALIRRRFAGDAGATDAMDRLDRDPKDPRKRSAVEERLEEALGADPEFAAEVERLAARLQRDAAQPAVTIRDAGAVAFGGGGVQISGGTTAAGRDVVLGGAAEPS